MNGFFSARTYYPYKQKIIVHIRKKCRAISITSTRHLSFQILCFAHWNIPL
jgi:hypothetical protein